MNVLLPASGYGKRNVGEPVKELMIRQGRPLIEFTFVHLLEPNLAPRVKKIIIITRKEKLGAFTLWLQKFCATHSFKIPVEFVLKEPRNQEEWPLSLLASQPHWAQKNLVLLPDTKLMLRDLVAIFDDKLEKFSSVWGTSPRDLDEVKSFGMIHQKSTESKGESVGITEKPLQPTSSLIWGCFGFQKEAGASLLKNLESSTHDHREFLAPVPAACVPLESFEDLSRGQDVAGALSENQGSNSSHS